MSIDYNKYLGPYIKINAGTRPYTKSVYGCTNDQCEKFETSTDKNDKYCNKCGDPLHNFDVTEEIEMVYLDHFFEHYCREENCTNYYIDDFIQAGVQTTYVPNIEFLKRETNFNNFKRIEDNTINLEDLDIKAELELMRNKFKKIINLMQNFYGIKNVTFGWGIVTWAS